MRPIRCVLVSLIVLPWSFGVASAQNVCVHGADGAIVCGPVAQSTDTANPSPFDQPQPGLSQPPMVAPPAASPPPAAPPRVAERHPPRRIAREDLRRRYAERDMPPPRRVERDLPPPRNAARQLPPPRYAERGPPNRYSEATRGPPERLRERPLPPDMMVRRYEARLDELEREVRALRAERDRYAPPRPPRRVARDRYSDSDRYR